MAKFLEFSKSGEIAIDLEGEGRKRLHNGKSASSPAPALSPRIWGRIQDHLGLPDHARGDFEKIVARHFETTAAQDCKENWHPQHATTLAGYLADGFNRHGMVMASKRGIKTMRPRNALSPTRCWRR